MKYTYLFITFCGVISLVCSCSSIGNKTIEVNDVELRTSNDLILILDDSTVQDMEYLQFFQRNDSEVIAITNGYDNSIVFYDYATRRYIDRVRFDREGSNGIGSIFSFYYLNSDSIFLYNMMMETLFLTNHLGVVKEKQKLILYRNLSSDSLFIAPLLFPRTNSPLMKVGDDLLISGFFPNEFIGEDASNRPVMTYYNLDGKSLRHSDSYPSMYHSGNWGGGFTYRNPYYGLSPKSEIVLSFAADPYIRVHDIRSGKSEAFYAGIGGDYEIHPAETKIDMKLFTREKEREHYAHNLSYGAVYYDKYRKIYYRLAFLPDSNININDNVLRKPVEIVVLNDKFELLGKKRIKDDLYLVNQSFVGPDGLHIQVQSPDDDELHFKTFVYEKDEI